MSCEELVSRRYEQLSVFEALALLLYPRHGGTSLDEKYRFSKTETLLKLYGNLELKFPV